MKENPDTFTVRPALRDIVILASCLVLFLCAFIWAAFSRSVLISILFLKLFALDAWYLYGCCSLRITVSEDTILISKRGKEQAYSYDFWRDFYEISSSRYCMSIGDRNIELPAHYRNVQLLRERFARLLPAAMSGDGQRQFIDAVKEKIRELSARKSYCIVYDKDAPVALADSKLGGLPYWDLAKEFPKDAQGNVMQLLCQINLCAEHVHHELLPSEGMLQFFVSRNSDCYGMDFDDGCSQKGWRIVYHRDIDTSVTEAQILALGVQEGCANNGTPVIRTSRVHLEEKVSFISVEDYMFDGLLSQAVQAVSGEKFDGGMRGLFRRKSDEVYEDEFLETFSDGGNLMLGYPDFTQNDPRWTMSEQEAAYFDTTLLKLGSEDMDMLMWGDCGIGCFMMNSQSLTNLDFSKVLYSWDCM